MLTAYDLFRRAYMHYKGQSWTTNKGNTSSKAYVEQSFAEVLNDYEVVYAFDNGFKLSRKDDFTNKDIKDLEQIELKNGYWLCCFWLCNYGHNGEWTMLYFDSKAGAKATYKKLSYKYTEDWYWIKQVSRPDKKEV